MSSDTFLDEYIDFQKYWLVLKRRWVPATAIFASVVTLALIKSLFTPDMYEAQAKLLIKGRDRTLELAGLENSGEEMRGLTQESDPLITEAEIVRSRPIVEKLIEELDLKDGEGRLLKYDDFVGAMSVEPIAATDILEVTFTSKEPELAASVVNKVSELYLEDHNLNNRSQSAAANRFISQQLPQVEADVKKAESELSNFKYQNGISSLQEETSANIDSISRIETQIDEIEAQLNNVNASYEQLQAQLNMDWQEAAAVSSLSESSAVQRVLEQLQEVKVTLAQRQNYLSDNSPQIISLREEEADLSALLDREIANTLDGQQQALLENFNIFGLGSLKQSQIANFAELGLQKAGLEKQLATLRTRRQSYQQKSGTLPRLQERQRHLERRVEVAESTYQILLRKLQQTNIGEQQDTGNVRIISKAAVPDTPLPSRNSLMVLGAGIVGALAGVGAAFALDLRDRTLKDTQEIEEMLPYSLIGAVPDHNKIAYQKQLLLGDDSGIDVPKIVANNISILPVREAYNDLQFNLQLLDEKADLSKVLVVTSAVSGEGKSSVAANLAIAKAQAGQKVLLVDGDLRYPTQHRLWEVFNDVGLSNVLDPEVKQSEWFDNIQSVMPDLDLMTAGKTSKQPISLLNSPLMEAFIVGAVGRYDCIILDSPPLIGLADTKILNRVANGLLLVVRPGVVNYGSVNTSKKILESNNFNVLGVVANGIDFDRDPYGREYYHPSQKYLEASTAS